MQLMKSEWTYVITPKNKWWKIGFSEIWNYRDLLFLFVRRDFVAQYKQTIFGPLWFLLQPILTTLTFTIIFGKVADIPTDKIPKVLFYMSGVVAWGYFSECLTKTSNTFIANAHIFGKVYFPRLILPLSIVISNLVRFILQYLVMLAFLFYYLFSDVSIKPNGYILLTPVLLVIMAGLGLGLGIIVSSLTTKYRDLQYLLTFGVQLLMYGTPVVYPLSVIEEKYKWIILINPMTSIIEVFRYSYLGAGTFNVYHLFYSFCSMILLLLIGLFVFNKVEKNFMDTV